jgi:DNA-binding transcriptional LysR family regulator
LTWQQRALRRSRPRCDHNPAVEPYVHGVANDPLPAGRKQTGRHNSQGDSIIHALIALGHILSNTDLIATVPERYVRARMAPFKLRYLPHPVPLPEFDVNLFWHARYHKEPGNQWPRSVIAGLAIDQGVSPVQAP